MPKGYEVLASGKLIDSSEEEETVLYEYELDEDNRTIPDRIGFFASQKTLSTPFEVLG